MPRKMHFFGSLPMHSRFVLSIGLLFSFSALLEAQNIRRQPAIKQATQPVQINGTIEGVMRGMIAVVDDNNQPWRVAVPVGAKISVTGTVTFDFLRSGLFVEFQAELNDRGEIQAKIDELTIVTISRERPIGLFPAGAAAGGDQDGFGAGREGDEKKRGGRTGKKRGLAAGAYRIVGRLIVGRGGKLSIQTDRGTARFELTEEPKINVYLADYTVAAKGDKVSIRGVMLQNRPGLARAKKVEIELAEPLAGAKKKRLPRPGPKHPPRHPKRNEGLPKDAEQK